MKKFLIVNVLVASSLCAFSNDAADSSSYYFSRAKALNQARKVWEADKSFQKAIAFNPADDKIRLEYVNYLVEQRKYFPAVEQVGKVLEKNLNNTSALSKMTELSFQLHRWNDVIIYGNKLAKQKTDNDLKFMLGKSYYELENYGAAQKLLNEVVSAEPKNLKAVTLLGKTYIDLSNYNQAVVVYQQTLALNPNDKDLIYELGLLYYAMNKEKEAVKYWEEAAAKGYKTVMAYYENLGLAYLGFDMKKGIETLNKVLENKPGNAPILFQIAQAYFKLDKFQEAANTYQEIFKNDPMNSRALYMTGIAYQKKGDKHKGISICEQAIKMDPNLAQLKTVKSMF